MNSILDLVPRRECDEQGVPLDWEECRKCGGKGMVVDESLRPTRGCDALGRSQCDRCEGHGSLKKAALNECWDGMDRAMRGDPRCEDCGHPMSEGTWEPTEHWDDSSVTPEQYGALGLRRRGEFWAAHRTFIEGWPDTGPVVHYSRCDEKCRHPLDGANGIAGPVAAHLRDIPNAGVRASWRPVDVRTLDWPMDLRPTNLAVLCLRCYAERTK